MNRCMQQGKVQSVESMNVKRAGISSVVVTWKRRCRVQ